MTKKRNFPAIYKRGGSVNAERITSTSAAAQDDASLTNRDKRRLTKGFSRMQQITEQGGEYIAAAPGLYQAVNSAGKDIVGKGSGRKVGKAMAYLRQKSQPDSLTPSTSSGSNTLNAPVSTQGIAPAVVASSNVNTLRQPLIDEADRLYAEQQNKATKASTVGQATTSTVATKVESKKAVIKRTAKNTNNTFTTTRATPSVSKLPVFNKVSPSGQRSSAHYDDGQMQIYPNGRFLDLETGFMGTKNESGYVYDEPRTDRRARSKPVKKADQTPVAPAALPTRLPVIQKVNASDALIKTGQAVKKSAAQGVANFSAASSNQNRNQSAIRDYYRQQREKKMAGGGGVPSSSGLDEFGVPLLNANAKGVAQSAGALPFLGLGKNSWTNPNQAAIDGRQAEQTWQEGRTPIKPLGIRSAAINLTGKALPFNSTPSSNSPALNKELPFSRSRLGMDKQVAANGNMAAGGGTKRGVADYANLAFGAYGLASVLTAKKPKLAAPSRYTSMINPATGLPEAQVNQARADISSNARMASRPQGSDNGANTMLRLGVNANTNRALVDLNTANATAYKTDQQRVTDQTNQDRQFNYGNQRNFEEQQYGRQLQDFQQRQQAGQGMIQNSLNYEQARAQDLGNKAIDERTANNRLGMMHEGDMADYRTALITSGKYSAEQIDQMIAAKANPHAQYQTRNYQKKRQGGKINSRYNRTSTI